MLSDLTTISLIFGAVAFLIGGTIKGVLGIGLPLFLVPMLATVYDLATAVTLMVVPVLASNLQQSWQGRRYAIAAVRRHWIVLLFLIPFTAFSASMLAGIDIDTGILILGVIVVVFATFQMLPIKFDISPRAERWIGPPVGALSGLIGGISNLFGPPLIMYFVALKLPKDDFVGSIAMFFAVGAIVLYLSLIFNGVLVVENVVASAIGAVPVMIGVWLGRKVRNKVEQKTFQRILLLVLIVIGFNLIRRSIS